MTVHHIAALFALLLALTACSKKPHFSCDKKPFMDEPERQCGDGKSCTDATCFYPERAYCFHSSRSWATVDAVNSAKGLPKEQHTGTWSPKTQPWCTPTLEECTSLRNGVGTGKNGQPPVKTPCVELPADQDPLTAPL